MHPAHSYLCTMMGWCPLITTPPTKRAASAAYRAVAVGCSFSAVENATNSSKLTWMLDPIVRRYVPPQTGSTFTMTLSNNNRLPIPTCAAENRDVERTYKRATRLN
eukprot:6198225-Pleurochrysis_carterae.AAC.5